MTAAPLPSLVADIGGTNTRVGLSDGLVLRTGSIRRYRNADHASLHAVLGLYLAQQGQPALSGVCAAVAGPVHDGAARMTNQPWELTEAGLARATGAPRAALLNDLQAQGHALGRLDGAKLRPVIEARAAPQGAHLVIGVGTGFNAAPVHPAPGGRFVAASETGHITLPVRGSAELRLMHHAAVPDGFASVEDVISGPGLERLDALMGSLGEGGVGSGGDTGGLGADDDGEGGTGAGGLGAGGLGGDSGAGGVGEGGTGAGGLDAGGLGAGGLGGDSGAGGLGGDSGAGAGSGGGAAGSGGGTRRAAEIVAALAAGEPRATRSCRQFVRLLGRVAGDLALIHLPFGGIWFVGGVSTGLAPHLPALGFVEAFRDKGRFSNFMEQFPVSVIEDDYAALTGCAAYLAGLDTRG